MALNIELFYIISRKLSLCGLFWTTLYFGRRKAVDGHLHFQRGYIDVHIIHLNFEKALFATNTSKKT